MAIAAIAAATTFTLAIMATAPVADATTTTTATTTSPEEAPMIELSPEVIYRERQINTSETPVNQTHVQLTTSGNGTLTLPNTTETISTASIGSIIASLDGTAAGKEVITIEDGSESATATFYGIARFGMEEGRGIIIALLDTNSTTGRLAPLDGMILAGQIEFPPEETAAYITLSEWQSGIPLPTGTNTTATTPTEEPSPLTDTTTTTTNATTTTTTTAADDTNAAATATADEVGGEEQQQQQQTTPTVPSTPAPNPLFE